MTGSDASRGQAVWQPGGAEEDSRLREGNRHLHLAYDEEEGQATVNRNSKDTKLILLLHRDMALTAVQITQQNWNRDYRLSLLFLVIS